MEIVLNKCYGGFGLSTAAMLFLIAKQSPLIKTQSYSKYTGGRADSIRNDDDAWRMKYWKSVGDGFYTAEIEHVLFDETGTTVWTEVIGHNNRNHPDLIEVVKTLGKAASGQLAELEILDIPDGIEIEIDDYDGIETAHEKHRSW